MSIPQQNPPTPSTITPVEIMVGFNVDWQPLAEYDPTHQLTWGEEGDVLFRMNQPFIDLSHRFATLLAQCPSPTRKAMYEEAKKRFYFFWEKVEEAAYHLNEGDEE